MQSKKQQESGVKEGIYMEKIEILQAEQRGNMNCPWAFIQEDLFISASVK